MSEEERVERAERALVSSAEAYRLFQEARDMRAQRDEELAARESEQEATQRLAESQHRYVERATAAEAEVERLVQEARDMRAERDALAAEVQRLEGELAWLTAAGIEPSAERALVSSAEAYRLVEEARQMRAERDEALAALLDAGLQGDPPP